MRHTEAPPDRTVKHHVVIEQVEIRHNDGLEIIGVGLGPVMTDEIWARVIVPGVVRGWPAPEVETSSVEGAVVPGAAGGGGPGERAVLVGARLEDGREFGAIEGVTVVYELAGTRYRRIYDGYRFEMKLE